MNSAIDHVVLTIRDSGATVAFNVRMPGLEAVTTDTECGPLIVDGQKINRKTLDQENRDNACIGSRDLCLVADLPDGTLIEVSRYDAA
ncbi:hypothetical protein [Rhodobacteraceae bacterium DSL-40]|uniref:hypothetical protein n=1 Tax=Amaricoccus sp. B4 TaxID=3368557 RepID=UPI000DAECC56